ncbi:MAG TPA: hypothetical protein VG225_13660 [Terracidiphilus sp.]|jgi:hypothetical protein|nr:hypothetical protein [Terracidiphilus sp.]
MSSTSTRMKGGQQSGESSGMGSSPTPERGKQTSQTGSQHTNAGNTGFGSGQISPQTHNSPRTGKSSGPKTSRRSSSGSDRKM